MDWQLVKSAGNIGEKEPWRSMTSQVLDRSQKVDWRFWRSLAEDRDRGSIYTLKNERYVLYDM